MIGTTEDVSGLDMDITTMSDADLTSVPESDQGILPDRKSVV